MKNATLILIFFSFVSLSSASDEAANDERTSHPLNQAEREDLAKQLRAVLDQLSNESDSVDIHSRRGDTLFFLRRYKEAVREYESMVKMDPQVDASHWRLGIAYFFAGQPDKGAAQFEKYHSFDDVDRENGIWRYLSQYKAKGAKQAKKELIRYQKDDREPFPAVYRLFDETLTPAKALSAISPELPDSERDKRLFYTELYIGMHLVVKKKPDLAAKHLASAVSRNWPRKNGFGPNYMWHVGRVQLEDLLDKKNQPASPDADR